jgi:maleate isomerase
MYGSTRANDGYRARIGVVIPSVNTVVEAWFARAAPPGVTVHVSRMPISTDTSLEAIMEMTDHEVAAAKLVADCEPDVIMYACTASTLVRGRAYDLELMDVLTEATGVPCCTTTEAILRALRLFDARRIAIATPYPEAIDERERAFFQECGVEVTGMRSFGIADNRELADPSPGEIYRLGREAWVPGSDALLISCLALRSHFIAGELERDLGAPVVTSTQATLWAALRIAGVRDELSGYGQLLQRPEWPEVVNTSVDNSRSRA